jgi:biopolymer transport protein ExbD
MARERKRPEGQSDELNMTAMIDIVFQLLIFFILTSKPMDVYTNLDVFRPSPEKTQQEQTTPPKLLRVGIFFDGFTINDRNVPLSELDRLLAKLGSLDRNQTVMIMCSAASKHADLVRVLDLCAKSGLRNLSVVSTN